MRPALQSAAVDGATLALTYDGKTLDGNSAPTASAFTVNASGTTRGVDGVSVSGRMVTLTLASVVEADDTVQVGYSAPSSGAIRDLVGNVAPSFTGQAVTNNTETAADPPPDPEPEETDPVEPQGSLTASVQDVPGSHDGQNVFTFELRFSEELKSGFKFRTLRDHALTATGGEITRARRLDGSGNRRWTIHVQPDGSGSVTVVLPATTDCGAEHAICTDDGRPLPGGITITVSGP